MLTVFRKVVIFQLWDFGMTSLILILVSITMTLWFIFQLTSSQLHLLIYTETTLFLYKEIFSALTSKLNTSNMKMQLVLRVSMAKQTQAIDS